MNLELFQNSSIIDLYSYQNEDKYKMKYAEIFYQTKRKKQILFIFKQFSLLKNKNKSIRNIKLPTMNLSQWNHIYYITNHLNPIISKFREYHLFQIWLRMIRRQKSIAISFIRFLGIRKSIILRSSLSTWSRALRLKRYYESIPVFPGEDLKLRAFRAFVIVRLRRKRDNENISSAKQASNFILICKTFDLWRRRSKLERLFQFYTKRYLANLLKSFFVTWMKNKRIHRRLVYLYNKLNEERIQLIKWKAFKKWQSKFFDKKILCKKSNKLIRFVVQMRTRRLFRKWQWSINYIHYIREAETYVQNNSSSFSWSKCFSIWKKKYFQKIQQKNFRKNQILSYFLSIKRSSFHKWQLKLNDILIKRQKIQRIHSNLFNKKNMKTLFYQWKTRYTNRKTFKMNWLKATKKWHNALLSTFFICWHHESLASNKYYTHLLRVSFMSFRKYHQHVIRTKYVLMTTYKLYQFYLQKNMILRWRSIIVQKKEMLNIQKEFRIRVLLDSFVHGSSNCIVKSKRKHDSFIKPVSQRNQIMCIKPIFTNDEKISELVIELKKIQKLIKENKDDIQLNQKYIKIVKKINDLQK